MCKFFSFVTYQGNKYFFNSEQRRLDEKHDSHTNIAHVSKIPEDRSNKYEFFDGKLVADSITDTEEVFDDVKSWVEQFVTTREYWKICVRSLSHGTACLEQVPERLRKQTSDMIYEFACWCAEQSLPNYEKQFPNDTRIKDVIIAKRKWIKGETTEQELDTAESAAESAAWSAARSAAWSAAWSTARSAAWSAQQDYLYELMEQVWSSKKE
jgi:hypothetical protein